MNRDERRGEGNRNEIHRAILEKVRRDPTVGRLRYLPFFDDLVETMGLVSQRVHPVARTLRLRRPCPGRSTSAT